MSCNDDNIDCTEVLDRMYEYLDGELTAEEFAPTRQHIERCGLCLEEFDVEQAIRQRVRRSCACEAPADLRARIVSTITHLRVTATWGNQTASASITIRDLGE